MQGFHAFGEHISHGGALVRVAVTILAHKLDIAERKTLEALWIAFKNPVINIKEERVALTQDLTLLLTFVGLTRGSLRG